MVLYIRRFDNLDPDWGNTSYAINRLNIYIHMYMYVRETKWKSWTWLSSRKTIFLQGEKRKKKGGGEERSGKKKKKSFGSLTEDDFIFTLILATCYPV